MKHSEIAQHRLVSQKLHKKDEHSPKEIVNHLGAIQAQDYAMAKWAIGARCTATEKEIEGALNDGKIIRTHILRPTWHFVAAEDIHWMLELSAPQVKRIVNSYAKKQGLDEKKLQKINAKIQKLLGGNKHMTREEIMQELDMTKNSNQEFLNGSIIMMNAELDGLVCNGTRKGKQITYTLLEDKVVKPNVKLAKEEALVKLAKRYFESHGPATILDFSWWSGFPITTCKLTLQTIGSELNSTEIEGQTYWFGNQFLSRNDFRESVHFLPAFDEILISYKTREASILVEHQAKAFTNNGIFKPIILQNGKVIGTWKRTIKKDQVKVEMSFFETIDKKEKAAIFEATTTFGNYLETEICI